MFLNFSHMPELKKILRDIMKQKEEPQEINLVSNQSKEKSTTDQNSTIGIYFFDVMCINWF